MAKVIDMTGQRFGRLTVIERAGSYVPPEGFGKAATWLCKCACGNECIVVGRCLRQGVTKSCGCLRKELVSKGLWKYNRRSKLESKT